MDDDELNYDHIESFWEWFEVNDKWIIDVLNDDAHRDKEELVQLLNNKVLQFGMFSWEMGRGTDRPYFLTISPNRDPELLQQSREIIRHAPELPHWEFNEAKPAQVWDMKINLYDDDLNEWHVDASSWKFVLQPDRGNKLKVLIQAKNISHLDDDTQSGAGEVIVTALVGEALRIEHISGIEVMGEFSQKQKGASHPIQELKGRVKDLLDLPEEY